MARAANNTRSTKLLNPHSRRGRPGRQYHRGATSMKAGKVSSASRWWRPASIILARRARRNQRKAHSRNLPAGCATTSRRIADRIERSTLLPQLESRRSARRPAPKGYRQSRFGICAPCGSAGPRFRTAAPLLCAISIEENVLDIRPSCAERPLSRRENQSNRFQCRK